jgi:hypothetical protein
MATLDMAGILTRICTKLKDKFAPIEAIPAVTSSDNGKVLRVVNGEWAADSLPSASGVSF